jgi:hypothetical protein
VASLDADVFDRVEEALLLPRDDSPMVGIDCCALEALHSVNEVLT